MLWPGEQPLPTSPPPKAPVPRPAGKPKQVQAMYMEKPTAVIEGMVYDAAPVKGGKTGRWEIVSKDFSNALSTTLQEYRGVEVRVTIESLSEPRCTYLEPRTWARCQAPATHVISFSDNPEDCTEACWEHLGSLLSDVHEMHIYRIAGKG